MLVSPGVAVPGQISITSSEVYFEVDEDHDDYKKIDSQVGQTANCAEVGTLSSAKLSSRGCECWREGGGIRTRPDTE